MKKILNHEEYKSVKNTRITHYREEKENLIDENNTLISKSEKSKKGITLIALVVTIVVLLILARNNNSHSFRKQWNIKQRTNSK